MRFSSYIRLMLIFDRLKKVQGKKKRDAAEAEAKRQALIAAEKGTSEGQEVIQEVPKDVEASADLLNSKDEDVIF